MHKLVIKNASILSRTQFKKKMSFNCPFFWRSTSVIHQSSCVIFKNKVPISMTLQTLSPLGVALCEHKIITTEINVLQ